MSNNRSEPANKLVAIFLASLAGVITAAVFGGGAMLLASISADSLGISPMEGGQGFFALAIGILAAPLAFLIGSGATLYFRGFRRWSVGLGIIGSGLLSVSLGAAAVGAWYNFQPQALVSNGPPPKLKFEINLPPNAGQRFDLSQIRVDLNTDENSMTADLLNETSANNILRGSVELYFRTSNRLIVLRLPNDEVRLFKLKLPSNPVSSEYMTWSEWFNADWIDNPGIDHPVKAENSDFQIRYKIDSVTD